MKISVVVPLQDPTPLSPFTLEEGLEASIAKVAEAGYDGVELAITDPSSIDVEEIKQLLERYNLEIPALTTGQAYSIDNLSLTDPDEEIRREAIQRIEDHISIARDFGAVVIIGLIRGERGGEEAKALLLEALQECAASDLDVKLALEPLNRYETKLVNNVDEALEVLDRVGMENVGILFDTFHANIEEPSIEESIRKVGPHLFHIHVADSNRWAPGYGHLDFTGIIDTLQRMSYEGALSAEILAKPSPDEGLQKAISYLKNLLERSDEDE